MDAALVAYRVRGRLDMLDANTDNQQVHDLFQPLSQIKAEILLAPDDKLLMVKSFNHLCNQLRVSSGVNLPVCWPRRINKATSA